MKNIVILPMYNEINNIEPMVKSLRSLDIDFDILIIDDNSPDGTGKVADQIAGEDKKVIVIHREGKLGLGTAYICGFKYALKNGYDYILGMDSDFSHNPSDVPRLFAEATQGADLVTGSRYIGGVRVNNWEFSRLLLSKGANFYANMILRAGIKDFTTGFRCYRSAALRQIDFSHIKAKGYGFLIEMTYRFFKKGLLVKEVPIMFSGREKDKSKMSMGIKLEAFFAVLFMPFYCKK